MKYTNNRDASEVKNSAGNYWEQLEVALKGSGNYQNKKKEKDNETDKMKMLIEDLINHLCLYISYNIDEREGKNKLYGNLADGEYLALKLVKDSIEKIENEMRPNFEEKILQDNKPVNEFLNNIKYLMNYYLKYKKVAIITYKMNAHQYILNSFKFIDTLEAIQSLNRDENIEKKLSIILECTEDTLKNLAKRMNSTLKNVSLTYEHLSSLNIFPEMNNMKDEAERMIFKNSIETTLLIRDIWALLRGQIYVEKQKLETINQYIKVTDKIQELYAVQMQLRSISIQRIFKLIEKSKNVDYSNIQRHIYLLLSELDGLIGRLESLYKEKLDSDKTEIKGMVINSNLGFYGYVP